MRISAGSNGFLFILGAVTATGAFAIDMMLPALPAVKEHFSASSEAVQLVIGAFVLGFGLGQLIFGPIADRFGRRPAILVGMSLFALAGVGCVLAPSLQVLVALRFLQGLGSSSGRAVAPAMIRDSFDSAHASRALSTLMMIFSVAPLLAPLTGGYLLLLGSWRLIFGFLAIGAIWIVIYAGMRLPETIREKQMRAVHPLEILKGYWAVLRHPVSASGVALVVIAFAGVFAYISGSPLILIGVFGVASHHFGYFFAMTALSLMLGAKLNQRLLRTHAPEKILGAGVMLVLAASVLLEGLGHLRMEGAAGIAALVGPMMLFAMGMSWMAPNATVLILRPFPKAAGMASSVVGFLQMLGAAFSSFLVGAVHDGTALPMIHIIAGGGLLASVLYWAVLRRRFILPDSA